MPTFRFEALDREGRTVDGLLEGDSPREIRDQLRERGLAPLTVEADSAVSGGSGRGRESRLPPAERATILRQLATLVRSGLPLEESLAAVAEQAASPKTRLLISGVRSQVMEGMDLSSALAAAPRSFPSELRAAIAAGERAGALDDVLERLADAAERRQGLARELGLTLIYPVLVVLVALVVAWALLTWVVPRVVSVFANVDQQLPWLTRALIATSEFFASHALLMGVLVVALVAVLTWAWRRPSSRAGMQGMILSVPVLGRALRAAAAARCCRSLSLQLASGVPLVDALQVASGAAGLESFRTTFEGAAEGVREGVSLVAALESGEALPPLAMRLVASGEKTGRLPDMLDRAAETLEAESRTLAQAFSALLQPLLILLVGALVLLIVLAIMLPILDLNRLVA